MRPTLQSLRAAYENGERLPMVTAYDYTSARLLDRTGIPLVLVGDSLGMVMQGLDSTVPVTLDDMIHHCRAVVRGTSNALVVADLPFLTYATETDALGNSARLLQEGGAQCVKLEGGARIAPTVRRLVESGIPVMGHLGFTPQSVHQIGMRVQGKDVAHATRLVRDALALQEAGAWCIVLELVPAPVARLVTERLGIPTIGIGAGPDCSGEVQVWHDVLGLYEDFVPRHTRRYRNLGAEVVAGLTEYADDVRARRFPTESHSSTLEEEAIVEVVAALDAP